MQMQPSLKKARILFTLFVVLAAFAHLAWEHFHSGIRTHHILRSADMPGFYNGWGIIILPMLAWFLGGNILRRVEEQRPKQQSKQQTTPTKILIGFLLALFSGASLAVAFTFGWESAAFNILIGILITAIVFPVYRAECGLGFILSMTLTFGAILPTIIFSIIAAGSAIIHLVIAAPIIRWLRHRDDD
jgi:Domain of unknown function (DUF389)